MNKLNILFSVVIVFIIVFDYNYYNTKIDEQNKERKEMQLSFIELYNNNCSQSKQIDSLKKELNWAKYLLKKHN